MKKIIRTRRSCPEILKSNNLKEESQEIVKYYLLPDDKRRLSRPPINNGKIFSSEVKVELTKVFSNRCAWCEMLLSESDKNIEHFRPRSNASGGNEKNSIDHYGWFAYEWENLFLTCTSCNRSKANKFPVRSLRAKPLSTWAEANAFEVVLLLNPCKDEPLKHISISENGVLLPLTDKGEYTISVFNLNRSNLVSKRGDIINHLIFLLEKDIGAKEFFNFALRADIEQGTVYFFLSLFFRVPGKKLSTSTIESLIKKYKKQDSFPYYLKKNILSGLFWGDSIYRQASIKIPHALFNEFYDFNNKSGRYLSRISIENFKGLDNFSLELSNNRHDDLRACTMLLGENSTGKSTILQAISLAIMGEVACKTLRLDYSDYLTKDPGTWFNSSWNEARVNLIFDDGTDVTLEIDSDFNAKGSGAKDIVFLAYGARRYVKKTASVKTTRPTNRTLFEPGAFIPNPSAWLRECAPEQFESVARAMKEILSLKQDDNLYRDGEGNVLVFSHKRLIPIEKMSDGYKTIFYVALDIMRHMMEQWDNLEYATGIVLIDEIETHLHPRWKIQVVNAFRRAMPNVQFIMTTHDPLCLRGMFNGEAHVLYRDRDNKIVEEMDLPDFQGLRTEQILTSDYFGLLTTNDSEVERKVEELSSNYSKSSNLSPYIKYIEIELNQMSVLGKTLSQRVVHEALARYLSAVKNKSLDARNLKEDAIDEILAILEEKGI
ncbi:AAA family ATPase [Pectobacterium polaris]|uniref:AAA family ATPase n=1 Tax=Pectobacterium polaris TaxID=2042057 RepID=UPI0023B0EA53|nr:AAA family ATPase [Pectobacterium polaris]MDE8740549.1 AAA family ATPase [Pectobacterium polaris]